MTGTRRAQADGAGVTGVDLMSTYPGECLNARGYSGEWSRGEGIWGSPESGPEAQRGAGDPNLWTGAEA